MSDVERLRTALDRLPDSAGVFIEDDDGERYELTRAFAIGYATDDPGLVLTIRRRSGPQPLYTRRVGPAITAVDLPPYADDTEQP